MVTIHPWGMTEIAMVVAFCFTSARRYQQNSSTVFFQLPKVFLLKLIFIRKMVDKLFLWPTQYRHSFTKTLDTDYGKYENAVFLGDFNGGIEATTMKSFCETYNLTNLIKLATPTCFKNPEKPSCIDFILTNRPKSFQETGCVIETGLSNFHRLTVSVLKMHFPELPSRIISNIDFSNYHKANFINSDWSSFW